MIPCSELISSKTGIYLQRLSRAVSLYSTATQNTWHWGLVLGNAPDARILCWEYQHVGILEPTRTLSVFYPTRFTRRILPDAKPKICVLPDAKPKCKLVEYRLRWVPGVGSLCWHVHFIFFVLISFALGSRRKRSFQWNMGFKAWYYCM